MVPTDAATKFHFVDNNYLRIDSGSRWRPKTLIRVNILNGGSEMLLDPTNGADATKITKWIRVK